METPYIDTLSGAPDKLLPNKESAFRLLGIIYSQLQLWVRLIDNYGVVKCIDKDPNKKVEYMDLFHDLVLFGYTKSCKSLMASRILIENIYQEDAQMILRSVYETYLSLNYLYRNPTTIDYFVKRPIGASVGAYEHPTSKKGKKIKNKIIIPDTGAIEDWGIPISTLATSLDNEYEKKIHDIIYPYLCEHTHFNMISSGNYRELSDEKKYTYINYSGYDQPIIIQEYIMIVYFEFIVKVVRLDNELFSKEIIEETDIGKIELAGHIRSLKLDDKDVLFRNLILNRLEK